MPVHKSSRWSGGTALGRMGGWAAALLIAAGGAHAGSPLSASSVWDAAVVGVLGQAPPAVAAPDAATRANDLKTWATAVWNAALADDHAKFGELIAHPPAGLPEAQNAEIAAAAERYRANLDLRETQRTARITELKGELDKHLGEAEAALAKQDRAGAIENYIKSLRHVVELTLIAPDRAVIMNDPRVVDLVRRSDEAARGAEREGQWLLCSELYALLNGVFDDTLQYKTDVMRQVHRLTMLRMYAPRRLFDMRNERLSAQGEKTVPKYNGAVDDFAKRLAGISQDMVVQAIAASDEHVERVGTRAMVLAGVEALRTMVTTTELVQAFPGLADAGARDRMLNALAAERETVTAMRREPGLADIDRVVGRLVRASRETVNISSEALLHEFGNGAFEKLDEFSQVVWPDELSRFARSTQGRFVGVGIQIELDDFRVRVVTPLDGAPAMKAGVRPGDYITAVNGQDVLGLSLDQVVELITGPLDTDVTISIERPALVAQAEPPQDAKPVATDAKEPPQSEKFDLTLKRSTIRVSSVKGWKKIGPGDADWDWFVAPGVGYVRLSQFAEDTTREFNTAVAALRAKGAKALVLDLRYNPGGYLNRAIEIANRFVADGPIVGTQGPGAGGVGDVISARANQAVLQNLPVVVLVNESSASASEIVSGVLQHYGAIGQIPALVMGQRSYGKGSVQTVTPLGAVAQMKLTTHYYALPDRGPTGFRIIHRKPGAKVWGVTPSYLVDMLPKATTDGLLMRRDADIFITDATPPSVKRVDADDILKQGLDLQLESAVMLLRTQVLAGAPVRQAAGS